MAESRLNLIIKTTGAEKLRKLQGDADKVEKEFSQLQRKVPKVGRDIEKTGKQAAGAAGGFNKLAGAVKGFVGAYAAIQVGKFVFAQTAHCPCGFQAFYSRCFLGDGYQYARLF